GAGVLEVAAAADAVPLRREVAVEVDAARVDAHVGPVAVGVEVLDDQQPPAGRRAALQQQPRDARALALDPVDAADHEHGPPWLRAIALDEADRAALDGVPGQ